MVQTIVKNERGTMVQISKKNMIKMLLEGVYRCMPSSSSCQPKVQNFFFSVAQGCHMPFELLTADCQVLVSN